MLGTLAIKASMGFLPDGDLIMVLTAYGSKIHKIYKYSTSNTGEIKLSQVYDIDISNDQFDELLISCYIYQKKLFIFHAYLLQLTQWNLSTMKLEMQYDLNYPTGFPSGGINKIIVNKNETLLALNINIGNFIHFCVISMKTGLKYG